MEKNIKNNKKFIKMFVFLSIFMMMFTFPLFLENVHAITYTSIGVSADQNESVYVNGTLITKGNDSYQTLSVPSNFFSISVSSASIIDLGYGSGVFFSYYVSSGNYVINESLQSGGTSLGAIDIIKSGDYLFHHSYYGVDYLASSSTTYHYEYFYQGYLNLSAGYGLTVSMNIGLIGNGFSGPLKSVSFSNNINKIGYITGIITEYGTLRNPYLSSPQPVPASVASFSYNQTQAISSLSIGESISGYNTTISTTVNIVAPNATLDVYSNVSPFNLSLTSPSFSSSNQNFVGQKPYPYSIGIINGYYYTITGTYDSQQISYSFTASSVNKYYFNFTSTTLPNSTGTSNTAKYNITFIESGLPQNVKWSVTFDGISKYTNKTSISFIIENGIYSYIVGAIGYTAQPSSGSVNLDTNITEYITFTNYVVSNETSNIPYTQLVISNNFIITILMIIFVVMLVFIGMAYTNRR